MDGRDSGTEDMRHLLLLPRGSHWQGAGITDRSRTRNQEDLACRVPSTLNHYTLCITFYPSDYKERQVSEVTDMLFSLIGYFHSMHLDQILTLYPINKLSLG